MATRRYLAAALAAAALAAAAPAIADSAGVGATQVVEGHVTAQFGAFIGADGSVQTNATTIPATVTRQRVNGVEIVTIAPAE